MRGVKTGGREQGTPNKITKETREVLKDIIENNLERLESDLESLEAKDRWDIIIRLLPYTLPKADLLGFKNDKTITVIVPDED